MALAHDPAMCTCRGNTINTGETGQRITIHVSVDKGLHSDLYRLRCSSPPHIHTHRAALPEELAESASADGTAEEEDVLAGAASSAAGEAEGYSDLDGLDWEAE